MTRIGMELTTLTRHHTPSTTHPSSCHSPLRFSMSIRSPFRASFVFLLVTSLLLIPLTTTTAQLLPTFPPKTETSQYRTADPPTIYHFNADGPSSLVGSLAYAPSLFGTHWPITGTQNGLPYFRAEVVLPNINDDIEACSALQSLDGFGNPFLGKILLVRRGTCAFSEKGSAVFDAGAIGMIIYGCDPAPPTLCDPGLTVTSSATRVDIPVAFIQSADGALWADYLKQRRDNAAASPTNTSDPVLFPPLSIEVVTTGPILPSERAALASLIADTSMETDTCGTSNGCLRPWTTAEITNSSLDPCIDRMAGLICQNGSVVDLELSYMNWASTRDGGLAPRGWSGLTNLQIISMDNNLFSGALPDEFCQLSNLQQLWIQSQNTGNLDGWSSLPSCLSQLGNLVVLSVNNNALQGSIPDFGSHNKLVYLYTQHNLFSGLPSSFSNWNQLRGVDLSFNKFTTIPSSYVAWNNLTAFIASDNQITTTITQGMFDYMPALQRVDISRNPTSGVLPLFRGSGSINSLDFNSNGLTGNVPAEWTANIPHLKTFRANQNGLVSPVLSLVRLLELEQLELMNNALTADTGVASQLNDVGAFVTSMLPPSIINVKLDYNQIAGDWIAGWLALNPKINSLSISHNLITRIPADLFTLPLTTFDASSNLIRTWGETDSPSASFLLLNLANNTQLVQSPLPAWMVVSDSFVSSPNSVYACPALGSALSPVMKILVDPTFFNYANCICAKGYFGTVPLCYTVPLAATLFDDGGFGTNEIGSDFTALVQSVAGRTISQDPSPETLDTSFTDNWYGSDRLTSGLSTTFVLDLRNRTNTTAGTSKSPLVPIRYLTVRIHLSAALFSKATDILGIYEGDASLSGVRIAYRTGADTVPSANSSEYTLSDSYQELHGASLAKLGQSYLWEIQVLTNLAAVYFSSRDTSGMHFYATYEAGLAGTCPPEYFFDNSLLRCRPPLDIYPLNPAIRIAVYVVASIAVVVVLANMLALMWWWDSQVIRAASRPFMLLLLSFLLMMSLGSFLYAAVPSENSLGRAICIGRTWLCAFPLTGVLAVLLAKTNRISSIFGSEKLQVRKRPDSELWLTIAAMLAAVSVFLFVYSFLPLVAPLSTEGTGSLAGQLVSSCDNKSGFVIWIAILLVFFFALMIWASFLAWKTRELPSRFNESSHIMNALFLLLFYAILIIPVDFSVQSSPESAVLIQGVGQGLAVLLLTGVIMVPKIYTLLTLTEQDPKTMLTQNRSIAEEDMSHDRVGDITKSRFSATGAAARSPGPQVASSSSSGNNPLGGPNTATPTTGGRSANPSLAAKSPTLMQPYKTSATFRASARKSGTLFQIPSHAIKSFDARNNNNNASAATSPRTSTVNRVSSVAKVGDASGTGAAKVEPQLALPGSTILEGAAAVTESNPNPSARALEALAAPTPVPVVSVELTAVSPISDANESIGDSPVGQA